MTRTKLQTLGVVLAISAVSSFAGVANAQEAVTRTDWQMHHGDGKQAHGEGLDKDALGAALEPWFQYANIPLVNDAGWTAAPDGAIVAFRETSVLSKAECKKAVDHTYFQTLVTVPATVDVTQFDLALSGMDDIARISIFNDAHKDGSIVDGSYVRRGQPALQTSDLKELLVTGENRVVITLLDNCGGNNNLDEARVELNGAVVPVIAPEPVADEKLCSPQTAEMIDISFVNNSDAPVSFHWMEFDCTEGGGPVLAPGAAERGRIGVGHIFLLRDADKKLIGKFTGENGKDFIVE